MRWTLDEGVLVWGFVDPTAVAVASSDRKVSIENELLIRRRLFLRDTLFLQFVWQRVVRGELGEVEDQRESETSAVVVGESLLMKKHRPSRRVVLGLKSDHRQLQETGRTRVIPGVTDRIAPVVLPWGQLGRVLTD